MCSDTLVNKESYKVNFTAHNLAEFMLGAH